MRVLVDTSVWSLAVRRKVKSPEPQAVQLRDLIAAGHSVFLTGIILTEVLSSIRHDEQMIKIRELLEAFPILELDRQGYAEAAQLSSRCRRKGVQASTIDSLIAQTAITHECFLLSADQDFQHIAQHCNLKLL